MAVKLRERLKKPGIIVAPGAPDALAARLIEGMGFEAVYQGGFMTGASLCTTEPLTGITEMAMISKYITTAVNIPLIVDGDSGFGDAVHTYRAVKEYEKAGIAAMHIEDQVFPKRVSYHRGLKHIISVEEMLTKIEAALKAREEMLIIARTDAIGSVEGEKMGGVEEAIRRCKAYIDAGADIAMPSGSPLGTRKVMKRIASEIDAPILVLSNEGEFGTGGEIVGVQELEKFGFKIVIYAGTSTMVATCALIEAYKGLKTSPGLTGVEIPPTVREAINEAQRMPLYWKMEDVTTELWEKERAKQQRTRK